VGGLQRGVTVNVTTDGDWSQPVIEPGVPLKNADVGPLEIYRDDPRPRDVVASAILVRCTGAGAPAAGPAPSTGGQAGGAGGRPGGTISGPDTGAAQAPAGEALAWWPALALPFAAAGLVAVRRTLRREA
jgi:hypothetical protein